MNEKRRRSFSSRHMITDSTYVALTAPQERLWFLHQMYPDLVAYNISISVQIRGPLCLQTFRDSIREVTLRHDMLRSRIEVVDEVPLLRIENSVRIEIPLREVEHSLKHSMSRVGGIA